MDALLTVTQEIGDTWLYGDPSDPLKNVHFREMSRLRAACVRGGGCDPASETMRRFDRLLTKIGEHTWVRPARFEPPTSFSPRRSGD